MSTGEHQGLEPAGEKGVQAGETTLAQYDFTITYTGEGRDSLASEELAAGVMYDLRVKLERDFSARVKTVLGREADVRVVSLESGSIFGTLVIVLAAGITVYEFIAQYEDFYQSLNLIGEQLGALIRRYTREELGPQYRANASLTRLPAIREMTAALPASGPPAAAPAPEPTGAFQIFANPWFLVALIFVAFLLGVILALMYCLS